MKDVISGWAVTIALLGALGIASVDLVTGWTAKGGPAAFAVVLGLTFVAAAVWSAQLVAGIRDRRRMRAARPALKRVVDSAARGVRRCSLLAAGISLLLFANCSGAGSGGSHIGTAGELVAPSQYVATAAWLILPLLAVLSVPAIVATVAQARALRGSMDSAAKTALIGMWLSAALISVVGLATTVLGVASLVNCFSDSHQGACAAGFGGAMNFAAIGSLLLTLPYLQVIASSLDPRPAPAPP